MKSRFLREIVENEIGSKLRLGDLIEYPLYKRKWKVVDLDDRHVTLED